VAFKPAFGEPEPRAVPDTDEEFGLINVGPRPKRSRLLFDVVAFALRVLDDDITF